MTASSRPTRIVALATAGLLLAASCGGSSNDATSDAPADTIADTTAGTTVDTTADTSAPSTRPDTTVGSDPPTTDVVTTEPVTTEPATIGAPPGAPRAVATTMTELLATVPAAVRTRALADSGSVQTTIIDVDAAARDAGVEPPADLTDPDAALESMVDLARGVPVDAGGTGVAALLPSGFPAAETMRSAGEIEDELGFSPLAVRQAVEISSPPLVLSVATGELDISSELPETGPGIFTAGSGDDLAIDPGNRTAARPVGRPLHLAAHDDRVGLALERSVLEEWLAPSEGTLLDVPVYAAVGAALDAAGTSSAVVFEVDSTTPGDGADGAISERFDLVAIGSSAFDGRAVSTIVYAFADDDTARRASADIEHAWRDGEALGRPGEYIGDRFDELSFEQQGPLVVVTAVVGATSTTLIAVDLYFRRETPFTHT